MRPLSHLDGSVLWPGCKLGPRVRACAIFPHNCSVVAIRGPSAQFGRVYPEHPRYVHPRGWRLLDPNTMGMIGLSGVEQTKSTFARPTTTGLDPRIGHTN